MAETYQDQSEYYKNILRRSKTAYSPGASPSKSDISLQRKYQAARNKENAAKQTLLKEQWYSDKKAEGEGAPTSSPVGGVLHALATPSYAVTGALESVLGKGRQEGLANIYDNIQEQGTAGDLLRSYNINNYVAAPLGFALDIALDPLSWATGGTSTLVGKVGMGAIHSAKAGESVLKGAKLGAEVGALNKASWLGSKSLKLGEKLGVVKKTEEGASKLDKARTALSALGKRTFEKNAEFDKLTGNTAEALVARQLNKPRAYDRLSTKLDETSWGKNVKKMFGYNSSKSFYGKKLEEDIALKAKNTEDDYLRTAMGKDFTETNQVLYSKTGSKETRSALVVQQELQDQARKNALLSRKINDEFKRVQNLLADDSTALSKLDDLSTTDKKKFMDGYNYYHTNLDSYNKNVAKLLLNPRARHTLNGYAVLTGFFKNMKIGGNVLGSSGLNSLVGNAAMTSMVGVNIGSKGMMTGMRSAYNMVQKGDQKEFTNLLSDADWKEILEKNPQLFEDTFGIRADILKKGWQEVEAKMDEVLGAVGKNGKIFNKAELRKEYEDKMAAVATEHRIIRNLNTAGQASRNLDNTSTFLSGEIMRGPYAEWLNGIKERGGAYEKLYKALTIPTETYGKFDQVYRMGLTLNLTREGITLPEFRKLIRRVPMQASDVVEKGGRVYLKPLKAMEVAQETYLNYAAMPAFVQIMRTIPLVGSPFMSFSYGMLNHASKTLMYNPEFYNKVQYMLHEISGEKSPLEKEALDSQYYSWMKQPGMMKIPFFQEHPVYLNVANMVPHYTMSILQTNQRDYQSKYGRDLSGLIDKSPFFKTPDGQMILDNVILPTLIADERPIGAFGQPLWEKDANTVTKIGYAGRSLVEALTPPMLGYLAPGASVLGLPEESIPYIPSYSFRKGANAVHGKGVTGIEGKENATERTLRALASVAGLSAHPVTLQYTDKNDE